MTRTLWAAAVLVVAGVATADEPQSPADKLAAIKKRVGEAEAEFDKAAKPLLDTPEGGKKYRELWTKFDKVQEEGFAAAFELTKANPKSDVGFAALEWVLSRPRAYYLAPGIPAMELAKEQYAEDPRIGKIIAIIGYNPPHWRFNSKEHVAAFALIHAVAAKNPDRTARAQAVFALAKQTHYRFAVADYEDQPDANTLADQAVKEFEAVLKDYGDCPNLWTVIARAADATIAAEAKLFLYELRYLRRGLPAPDINAADLDGVKFKLSDHRGKVVLLVFWASWCGPCMAAVPHERELVEKFKGRPFVLIGVNGDETIADAKKAVESAKINWRSFWNGEKGPRGAIAADWNIRGWPTEHVIDRAGIIQKSFAPGKELDEQLEKLVAEAEKAAK